MEVSVTVSISSWAANVVIGGCAQKRSQKSQTQAHEPSRKLKRRWVRGLAGRW